MRSREGGTDHGRFPLPFLISLFLLDRDIAGEKKKRNESRLKRRSWWPAGSIWERQRVFLANWARLNLLARGIAFLDLALLLSSAELNWPRKSCLNYEHITFGFELKMFLNKPMGKNQMTHNTVISYLMNFN